MNSFCATYSNKSNLLINLEVSLLAMPTPPYKNIDNQIINLSNTVESHILALQLGSYRAECVTPFFCA